MPDIPNDHRMFEHDDDYVVSCGSIIGFVRYGRLGKYFARQNCRRRVFDTTRSFYNRALPDPGISDTGMRQLRCRRRQLALSPRNTDRVAGRTYLGGQHLAGIAGSSAIPCTSTALSPRAMLPQQRAFLVGLEPIMRVAALYQQTSIFDCERVVHGARGTRRRR